MSVYQTDAQGNIPTQLGGVQVLFDGVPVPIIYAQSQQINAIAPAGLTVNGTTQVTVTYNNQQFGPAVAKVIFGSPGIFRLQFGQSAQAAAINQDGTLNGPTNPAARGSVVAVWGTGYGQTNPPCPIGGLNVPYAAPLSPGISALILNVDPGGGQAYRHRCNMQAARPRWCVEWCRLIFRCRWISLRERTLSCRGFSLKTQPRRPDTTRRSAPASR